MHWQLGRRLIVSTHHLGSLGQPTEPTKLVLVRNPRGQMANEVRRLVHQCFIRFAGAIP